MEVESYNILVCFVVSLVLSYVMTKVLVLQQFKIGVLDTPGKRKIHNKVTPTMGGLSIYIAFIIGYCLFVFKNGQSLIPLVLSSSILLAVGVMDDICLLYTSPSPRDA